MYGYINPVFWASQVMINKTTPKYIWLDMNIYVKGPNGHHNGHMGQQPLNCK